MSAQYAGSMSILVGGVEFACNATSASFDASCAELDTTPLCNTDGWRTYIAGLATAKFSIAGNQDYTTIDPAAFAAFAVAGTPLSFFAGGAVDGGLVYFSPSLPSTYTQTIKVGVLTGFTLAGRTSPGRMVRGLGLHPLATARTTSGTGTQQSLGALTSAQSLYAQLHVTGFTAGTLVVKVQSATTADTGFASPTDRITFTTASGVTSEAKNLSGAITDTRWRVAWTVSGGGTWNFAVSAGIAGH